MIQCQTKRQQLEKLIDEAATLAAKKQADDDEDMSNYSLAYSSLMNAMRDEMRLGEFMMIYAVAKVEEIGVTCPEIMEAAKQRIAMLKLAKYNGGWTKVPIWKLNFIGQEKILNDDGSLKRWTWGYTIQEIPTEIVEETPRRVRNLEDDCIVGACGLILGSLFIGPCLGIS